MYPYCNFSRLCKNSIVVKNGCNSLLSLQFIAIIIIIIMNMVNYGFLLKCLDQAHKGSCLSLRHLRHVNLRPYENQANYSVVPTVGLYIAIISMTKLKQCDWWRGVQSPVSLILNG